MAFITSDRALPARRFSLNWLSALFASRAQSRQERLCCEDLLRTNDHMLKDMGLTVDEVKHAILTKRRWL